MSTLYPVITIAGQKHEIIPNDPSTIFFSLKVIRPNNPTKIPFPTLPVSYATLDPCQRYIYLNWLKDVSKPVPGKYVALYYYGLERHLLYGDFDAAFEEIMFLRQHHSNLHFKSASIMGLLWACSIKKKWELLASILPFYDDHHYGFNLLLTYIHRVGIDLSYDDLFNLRPRFSAKVNTRYIHIHPELYLDSLRYVLLDKYNQPSYPLRDLIKLEDLEHIRERAFANPSIPYSDRFAIFFNFKHNQKFNAEVGEIFAAAHERTKVTLRNQPRGTIK